MVHQNKRGHLVCPLLFCRFLHMKNLCARALHALAPPFAPTPHYKIQSMGANRRSESLMVHQRQAAIDRGACSPGAGKGVLPQRGNNLEVIPIAIKRRYANRGLTLYEKPVIINLPIHQICKRSVYLYEKIDSVRFRINLYIWHGCL